MMGSSIDDATGKGMVPRIVEQIFASIMSSPGNIEYTVRVSYMEIYMERIRDLLAPQNDNLPIHEEKGRGVYVKGLLEIYVSSVAEVYEVMRQGGRARATAATNMNQESSRSHSMFQIIVSQKNVETGSAKAGVLFLVDLAGSEKVGKTGASGQTLEEAKKINKSLSALGMVINSLTDGKSTHVPYRDSKLTRILQESLGGNAKTTLIINCSPSSYNVEETLSTLRFGVRAKKIHNKAKINAELSPAELKALLKKAQTQVTTFEDYIFALEGEVGLWRNGETIPRERWTPARSQGGMIRGREEARRTTPIMSTPSGADLGRSEFLTRSESQLELERASTPSTILDKDEREEFLRRENELMDQLSERESQASVVERELQAIKCEFEMVKQQQRVTQGDFKDTQSRLADLDLQYERLQFEQKEVLITTEGLKEANAELTAELDDAKQRLLEATIKLSEGDAGFELKERRKGEKMALMMAELTTDSTTPDQAQLASQLKSNLDNLQKCIQNNQTVSPDDLEVLSRGIDALAHGRPHTSSTVSHNSELEQKLAQLERTYEGLLERNLDQEDIEDIKLQLEARYAKREYPDSIALEDLQMKLSLAASDNKRLQNELYVLLRKGEQRDNEDANHTASQRAQSSDDMDAMRTRLMRDLQNRCQRVVELEIALDESREQYENLVRASSAKAQSNKMIFLEKSLEQLNSIQKQLVEQNQTLKKEAAIAVRKLEARNERIGNLERTLNQSCKDLNAANQRYTRRGLCCTATSMLTGRL